VIIMHFLRCTYLAWQYNAIQEERAELHQETQDSINAGGWTKEDQRAYLEAENAFLDELAAITSECLRLKCDWCQLG